MQCVYQSALSPPGRRELRIFNQIMETFSANQLAEMVVRVARARGHDAQIKSIPNPRREAEKHYYNPSYQGLKDIGVEPHLLSEEVLNGFFEVVERHRDNIRPEVIFSGIKW